MAKLWRSKFHWIIRFFTLTSNWANNEESMYYECIHLCALSEKVLSFEDVVKMPIYLRKKLIDKYLEIKEQAKNQGNPNE